MNKLAVNFGKPSHRVFGLDLKSDLKEIGSIQSSTGSNLNSAIHRTEIVGADDYIVQQLFSVNVSRFRGSDLPPNMKLNRMPTIMMNNKQKLPKLKKKKQNAGVTNIKSINQARFQHIKPKVNTTRKESVPVTRNKLSIERNVLPNIHRNSKQEKELNKTNTNVYYHYYKDNRAKSPVKNTKQRNVNQSQAITLARIIPEPSDLTSDSHVDCPSMAPIKSELTLELDTIKSASVKTTAASTTRTQQGENPVQLQSPRRNSIAKEMENFFQSSSSRRGSIDKETIGEEAKPMRSRRKSVAFTIDEGGPENEDEGLKKGNRINSRRSSMIAESPFPMFTADHFASNPSHKVLSVKDMKELPLSTKFYPEASRMIFNTEGKSFIPKGHLSHLASMKRSREADARKREEELHKSREELESRVDE